MIKKSVGYTTVDGATFNRRSDARAHSRNVLTKRIACLLENALPDLKRTEVKAMCLSFLANAEWLAPHFEDVLAALKFGEASDEDEE